MKSINEKPSLIRMLVYTFVGHFLELYDYTVFVVLLPVISPLFFPTDSLSGSVNIGMIIFAVSILVSIPGAVFWGMVGDQSGRLVMLRKAILMMGLPSLLIALLPTFQEIGIWAPLVLFLCRMVQTFSASGEMNGGRIFLTEHFGDKHIGKITGYFCCLGALGVLLAMLMGWLITTNVVSWRSAFFLGSCLSIVAIMLRRKIAESPEFVKLMSSKQANESNKISTFTMLKENSPQALIIFAITTILGILSYMLHGFINPFIISLGVDKSIAYKMSIVGMISCGIFAILFGYLMDHFRNERSVINYNFIGVILLVPIGFLLIKLSLDQGTNELIYLAFILFGGLLGMNVSAAGTINYKLFSPANRCRGILICYAVPMAIFGGMTPIVLKTMGEVHFFAPSFTVAMVALVAYYIYGYNKGYCPTPKV